MMMDKSAVICRSLLVLAGVWVFSSPVGAEEVTIENVSLSAITVRGKNNEGKVVPGLTIQVNADTKVVVKGVDKPFLLQHLQKGWIVDVASTKPKGASKDSTSKLATTITIRCDWISEAILNSPPTPRGASIQGKLLDRPVNVVIFWPNIETKGMDDKKFKDLTKGTKVDFMVVSGSMPPVALLMQLPAPPTPLPSPTPTKTPIPIVVPPTAMPKATVAPTNTPGAASQPAEASPAASQAAAVPPVQSPPAASQPAVASPVASQPPAASQPQAAQPAPAAGTAGLYQVDFSKGLPDKWEMGVLVKDNLPPGSQGAVTAKVNDGAADPIKANPEWVNGHFTIEEGLFVNFRMRMAKPEWLQMFLFVKDKGPAGTNSLLYEGKPDITGLQPNEWKVVSIPIQEFKSTTGEKVGSTPPPGQICWVYFWDTQRRDLGLTIDSMWVTKGQPGTTPPPAK